jgi:hypothetical protein
MIELARIMKEIENDEYRELALARQLGMMFENRDSYIHSVKWDKHRIILRVELMSSLLGEFPRFAESDAIFIPADLLAVVPITAIVAEDCIPELEICALEKSDGAYLFLGFSGQSTEHLALAIWRVLKRWETLAAVLYKTIEQSYPLDMDWREFLSGESGFVIMKPHRRLTHRERKRALNNVCLACVSLLRSVLDDKAWSDNRVGHLISFINNLQAQDDVPSIEMRTPELEVAGGATK